jgi:hypothetical protein
MEQITKQINNFKRNQRVTCECGKSIIRRNIKRHLNTKIHFNRIMKQELLIED